MTEIDDVVLREIRAMRAETDALHKTVVWDTRPRRSGRFGIQGSHSFAAMVEREVPCDWTPEADEASQ